MAITSRFREVRTEDSWVAWLKIAVAIWLFISPWVLASGTVAAGGANGGTTTADTVDALSWNAWIAAVVLAWLAVGTVAATVERQRALQWQMVALGAWLFISPWVLDFVMPALSGMDWNYWAIGALVFFLSLGELGYFTVRGTSAVAAAPVTGADLRYAGNRPTVETEPRP